MCRERYGQWYGDHAGLEQLGTKRFVDRNPCDGIKIVIIGREDSHPQMLHDSQSERVVGQQPFLDGQGRATRQEVERDRLYGQAEAAHRRDDPVVACQAIEQFRMTLRRAINLWCATPWRCTTSASMTLWVASARATEEVTPWTRPSSIRLSKSEHSSESVGASTRW